jgi:hypothetical protein
MKTSLFAQLMSVVLTSREMVMIRYMDAKHTLMLSANLIDVPGPEAEQCLHIQAGRQ